MTAVAPKLFPAMRGREVRMWVMNRRAERDLEAAYSEAIGLAIELASMTGLRYVVLAVNGQYATTHAGWFSRPHFVELTECVFATI